MSAYAEAGAFLVVGTRSMKLRRFATLSSVFVCFSAAAPAFAATLVVDDDFLDCPQADYSSIQAAVAAAKPGDKILVCPGRYLETVVVDATKPDLRIEAQGAPGDVVLVGTSAQLAGFYLHNTSGVLVQGFTVQGFGFPFVVGVPLSQGANIRIEGSADPLEGISSGNTLRKNVTKDSLQGNGIQVLNSSANVVEQNSAFANTGPRSDGIELSGEFAFENIIRHNETFNNGQTGINIVGPTGFGPTRGPNVVSGNRSHHNNGTGIRNISFTGAVAAGAHGTVIENNHVFANGVLPSVFTIGGGIIVGASHDVIVRNNRSETNNPFGIRLQNAAVNNMVEKNEVFQNTQDGIQLVNNADANRVQLNLVRQNGRDGIRVDPTSGGLTPVEQNTIERNVIRESGQLDPQGLDAHDDSVGPGTGGTGNFWINNKCETENRPELCKNP